MSMSGAFLPQSVTLAIAASAGASANVQHTGVEPLADTARIYNNTNGVAWVNFSKGAAVAAVVGQGTPVPPATTQGQVTYIRVIPSYDFCNAILAVGATSGNVYVQRGDGGF